MFNAQYLFKGESVFSPWMSRGGDSAICTLDVIKRNGSNVELLVKLFTKNSEDPGSGSAAQEGGSDQILVGNGLGRFSDEWSDNLDELVRYRFECSSTTAGDYALFRMLSPVWFNDVQTS